MTAIPITAPITIDDIESLAIGAWILGTGGGGSPYLGLLNMRRLYADGHRVSLMDPKDLADDDLVAVVSNMGAPLVGQERLTDSRTMARAVRMMEDYIGRKFRAIMSVEIGGGNSIQPMMGAGHLHLPVVDAGALRPAGGRRRRHGARLSRGADDQLRDRGPQALSLDPGRRARELGRGRA